MKAVSPLNMLEKGKLRFVNFVLIRFDFELIRECFRVENDFVKVSIMILRCF
jgi:hypothetical protein